MSNCDRRQFLTSVFIAGGALSSQDSLALAVESLSKGNDVRMPAEATTDAHSAMDFRYAPRHCQTAICFPDDACKSLVDERGRLLYCFESFGADQQFFGLIVGFEIAGMGEAERCRQHLESAGVPIVHTTIERSSLRLVLTAFATKLADEGRIDNVVLRLETEADAGVLAEPVVRIHSVKSLELFQERGIAHVCEKRTKHPLMALKIEDAALGAEVQIADLVKDGESSYSCRLHPFHVTRQQPYVALIRIPQAAPGGDAAAPSWKKAEACLESARAFWLQWKPFQAPVDWRIAGQHGEFLKSCARNILQAREVRHGELTFQVGPTVYRGLWVVDGNFILEAARYLGYDTDAEAGLRTTWSRQLPSGQVTGGGGSEHWKDTAIAIFTLARQCELSQNWSLMREMEPQVVRALDFLDSLRKTAAAQGGPLGRYGLLPPGFPDGGIGGIREEFTNTLWTLAGLKAIREAGEKQKISSFSKAAQLYRELFVNLTRAAKQEMRIYPDGGFRYLPMLLKSDPLWQNPDPWEVPRAQSAQWALSHAIFPGLVFDPSDPIVRGHVELMLAVLQEDIPAETGWIHHEGVWTYNAAFVAQVLLWLGRADMAHRVFTGFLNHASPQYCWREEQPLQTALTGSYIGDMPHNWASAECIRYLRHMLALEDGPTLRLLEGVTHQELSLQEPFVLRGTPTRFGRLNLELEPLPSKGGWRLLFERSGDLCPEKVTVPARLAANAQFAAVEGAQYRRNSNAISIEPEARRWTAFWKRRGA